MKSGETINPRVDFLIKQRRIARMIRERKQIDLIKDTEIFHQQIVDKLTGLLETNQFHNLVRCGHENIFRTCKCCGRVETFFYRCSLKWCPSCQWRISKRREEKIKCWSSRVRQPKHLVLTQSNFRILTPRKIREHQINLAKFRRTKVCEKVRGGCCAVEITNEGKGWHLHSHWLLDVDYMEAREISGTWAKLVGQEFAIVKIKDVRQTDYIHELCKYLAKGDEIAKWPREQILEFVTAIYRKRFFFSFGSLFKLGDEVRQQIAFLKQPTEPCECGKNDFLFEDERQAVVNEIRRARRGR